MTQQLDKYFGLRLSLVREIDLHDYVDLTTTFTQWLEKNPAIKAQNPELYIHKVIFDIEPTHFTVSGIENRLTSLRVSVQINEKLKEKEAMRFINEKIGHRLYPQVKHTFGQYKNTYVLEGGHLLDASHFEEYLATVIVKPISPNDKKVKFTITAQAALLYGTQNLKNVPLPAVTKFDFWLIPEVQVKYPFRDAA